MEKNSKDQILKKIEQHNRNLPKTIFETKPQEFLTKLQTFGVSNQSIYGQFTITGKDQVLYYCSSMLVLKSLDRNTSRFLYREGKLKSVTVICTSTRESDDKQLYIAAGESPALESQKASITFIKLMDDQQQWKSIPTQSKGKIQYLQFNSNKTKIGCLITSYDQIIFSYIHVQKGNILVTHSFRSTDVKRFTINMNNEKSVFVYGDGLLKMYQFNLTQKSFKDLGTSLLTKQNKDTKFVDHMWIHSSNNDPHTLVLISHSKIFMLKNDNTFKIISVDIQKTRIKSWNVLNLDNTKDPEEQNQVIEHHKVRYTQKFQLKCLMKQHRQKKSYDNSLIMGASNGLLIIYNMSTAEFSPYQILSNDQILCLTSNPNRTLLTSVSRNYYEKNLCFHLIKPQMLDNDDVPIRCLFGQGSHSNGVTSLSIASSRQFFVSTSLDKSIRLWNYNSKQSIISGNYKETPIAVSIHPSGFSLAIAFINQIDMYSILSKSLYLTKSIKNLQEVKNIQFSHKGHFLVSNQSNCLKLYDPNTFRVLSIYQMDDGRMPFYSFCLSSDDSQIAAIFQNGSVYFWQVRQGHNNLPSEPCHIQPSGYHKMIIDSDIFVGANNQKYLCLYKNYGKTLINEFPVIDCTVSSLLLSKQLSILFVGTSIGSVRLYSWPITESGCLYQIVQKTHNKVRLLLPNYYECFIHNKHINTLSISEDCRYLFGGMDNGGIMMMQIKGLKTFQERNQKNKQLFLQVKQERKKIKETVTNLYLICETRIRDKDQQMRRMEDELQKMQQQIQKQKISREKYLKKVISQKLQQYSTVNVKQKLTKNQTVEGHRIEVQKLQGDFQQMKKTHQNKVLERTVNHENSKKYEMKRKQDLIQQISQIKRGHIQKLNRLLLKHKQTLNQIKYHYNRMGDDLQAEYKEDLEEAKQKYTIEQIDLDQQQVDSNTQKIKYLQKIVRDLKDSHLQHETQFQQNKIADEKLQIQFNSIFQNQNNFRLKNIREREEILKMEHQLNERINSIKTKQQSYKQATQYQTNLQNYKSVIDDRITKLQYSKKQYISKIRDQQTQLEILFNQLISATGINQKKQFQIQKLQSYKQNLEGNMKKSQIQIFFAMKRLKNYEQLFDQLMQLNESSNKINIKIQQFLSKPRQDDFQMVGYLMKNVITDDDMKEISKLKQQKGNQENNLLQNQGKVISKKFNLMKFTCRKMKDIHQNNISYNLKQNQKLTQECNLLRYQNECYQKQIKKVQKYINSTIQEQTKLALKRRNSQKLQQVEKKLIANEMSLKEQTFKLDQIREFLSSLKDKQNEDL